MPAHFLGAAVGLAAVLLMTAHGGPQLSPAVNLFQAIGCNLIIVSSVLILRVLFTIFRSGR